MAKKVTMKEKVLQYVEQRGSARYTDIIKFVVDTKFGSGSYDWANGTDYVCGKYIAETNTWKKYKANPYRGYYSSAFVSHNEFSIDHRRKRTGYFLKGADCLEKVGKLYYTVRTATPKVPKTVQPKVQSKSVSYASDSIPTTSKLDKLDKVLKTLLNKTQPNIKASGTKTFEKTDTLNVNIALDPSLNWIVKTINGKSYLSISN